MKPIHHHPSRALSGRPQVIPQRRIQRLDKRLERETSVEDVKADGECHVDSDER